MRKQIISESGAEQATVENQHWLDLETQTRAELTSEDPNYPIEAALSVEGVSGWRATETGAQTIRLLFDEPVRIRCIRLVFRETEIPRTQEYTLRWRSRPESDFEEIVRQQYTFSPPGGTTEEREDYTVECDGLTALELSIIPDISGGPALASLAQLRVA